MKKINMLLNFQKDTLIVKKIIKLQSIISVHYSLSFYRQLDNATSNLIMFSKMKDRNKKAYKLQKQFGHHNSPKLIKLIHNPNMYDTNQ